MKYFNTAGPVNCDEHYCLPPIQRFDLEEIEYLIDQKKYFVLHAPRQTGKTSSLLALMEHLNAGEKYRCLYVNVEPAQAARENVKEAMSAVLNETAFNAFHYLNDDFLKTEKDRIMESNGAFLGFQTALSLWAKNSEKPLVLLIDEVDAMVGDSLISLLRQLRAGYPKKPALFPQSIILCGVRDVRDYRIHSDREKTVITGGSAFNVKAKSLRLGNFSPKEVAALLKQHEDETGQLFEAEGKALIWEYSAGQPWLVNALAYEVCFEMKEGRDRGVPITKEMIETAKENLILRRETHLDQLADKLREERVRRVISPILQGVERPMDLPDDDIQYVRDLGLLAPEGVLKIANPIYAEVIPRQLTFSTQQTIHHEAAWYKLPDGRLDASKLMAAFQDFFREHSEHWIERFQYKEAGPHLLLQAFLQRVVNAGGRIDREYGLGRKRADLLVVWKHGAGVQKVVIELKILYKSLERTIEEGLEQTADYMDKSGADEGHLVIFDRREGRKWEDKIFQRDERLGGKVVRVWGM